MGRRISEQANKTIRLGLIGCGRIAQRAHLPALSQLDAFEVVAVADPSPQALTVAEQALPGCEVFEDYRDLLAGGRCEAVLIAAPPFIHAATAIAAFDAGCHVYLEKPLAASLDEAASIRDAWRRSERVGVLGFNYRFHPDLQAMREAIQGGSLGPVVSVRSVFTSSPRRQEAWKHKRSSGGGVLLDLGSHHLDLIPWLLGRKVAELSAWVDSRKAEADAACLNLRLTDGTLCQSMFLIGAAATDRIEVIGERGRVEVDRLGGALHRHSGSTHQNRVERTIREVDALLGARKRVMRPDGEPSYAVSLRAFADAVRGEPSACCSLDEAYESFELLDAAERSAAASALIRLRPVDADPTAAETPAPPQAPADTPAQSTPAVPGGPKLSVVLVTTSTLAIVQPVLRHIGRQTIRGDIELILVGPDVGVFDGLDPTFVESLHRVERVGVGPIENTDAASAHGIRAATAPIIAIVEDHAFPRPGWAEGIVRAHDGPWSVVGSTFENANPRSLLSWANMVMSYGQWVAPVIGGETENVSRHNVSFKRDAIMAYHGELDALLVRDGGLMNRLLEDGHRFYLASDAVIEHVNPSRLSSTLRLRFNAGRLRASGRARRQAWPAWRRWAYVLTAPALPVLLFRGMRQDLFGRGQRETIARRGTRALVIGAALDGAGQVAGFAFGPGRSAERLAAFEFHREQHLRGPERGLLTG